jgi:ammonium transporter Rh
MHFLCGFLGGGYYIHIFGCYYGLSVCLFLTTSKALRHPDNISSYASDLFAFAGTLFLWMMWPSFNSVIAPTGIERVRGSMNTWISLLGSTVSTFVVSRIVSKGKFDAIHIQNATLSGGVAMGVAAHLQIFPATALGSGLFIGVISTLGFKYLTPFLAKYAHIHDTCGINNLHGMPGIYGALLSIFASWVISQTRDDYIPEYVHGGDQPLIQFAALGITLGIAILSGLATGMILLALIWVGKIHHRNYFHDREFWIIPYDYDEAATEDEEE